jgi:PAS domain S-box-containing protein
MRKAGSIDEKIFFKAKTGLSIWLTTLAIITLILLLALTVHHTREKEMVELFSRQQMAIAASAAAGIEDLLISTQKSMTIVSGLPLTGGVGSEDVKKALKIVYDSLDSEILFVGILDGQGTVLNGYPSPALKGSAGKNLKEYLRSRKQGESGQPSRSRIAVLGAEWGEDKESGMTSVIMCVPPLSGNSEDMDAVCTVLSLKKIIDRYGISSEKHPSAHFSIVDTTGMYMAHSKPEMVAQDARVLEGLGDEEKARLKDIFLKGERGYGAYRLQQSDGRVEKTIIAHAPIHIGADLLSVIIRTPYKEFTSVVRKASLNIIFVSLGLVFVIVIAVVSIAYTGTSQLRFREELNRLKEKEDWQEKLIRESKTIEGIIEGSPIPMFVINKDHKVILWNKACAELTGYSAEDMIGTDGQYRPFYSEQRPVIADLIVDNDIDGLHKYYGKQMVRESGVVEGAYEARDFYESLGGKSRHLYFLAAPIYDEKGDIIAAIETLQDVTRVEEMAAHLTEYAETLKGELVQNITLRKTIEGIIEGSPISMFVINKDHKVILWNKACAELTGYNAEDMIGADRQYRPFYSEKRPVIADLIVDNDFEGLQKFYGKKRVQESGTIENAYEARDFYENLGGKSRHLYFLAAPIYDEKGDIIAAIETLQDVSREREMEMGLKEYAETLENELNENIRLRKEIEDIYNYLQSILDSSPDKLFDISADGIINYMSKDEERGKGLVSQQVKGKHIGDFVVPELRDISLKKWEDIKRGIYTPYEIETIAKDGSKRNLLITPRPVEGTDRYVFVQRDLTEFKNLEKKFYESQKLAAIGQLSAGIAHEVRNPLSSIKMSLQILEKRIQPDGNDLKRFKIARREVEHLEKLVNDVLIYARPADPKKEPSDMKKILEHALAMVEKSIADKHIVVRTAYDDTVPTVSVDRAMLEQTFLNIYHNAIDAMEDKGILSISTKLGDDGKDSIQVIIEDNGCGIDADDIPHLFNPFFTRKKYGTGLGLTQIKKILDQHESSIEIASKPGEGTRVTVSLPIEINT